MLRRSLALLSASTVLAGTFLAVGPPPSAEARPSFKPYGSVSAPDQRLLQGCHRYRLSYHVTVPSQEWSAEIFVVKPNGTGLAAFAIDANAPARKRATVRYTVCSPSTTVGRHKLKMKVTYCPDLQCRQPVVEGFVRPSTFRFTR